MQKDRRVAAKLVFLGFVVGVAMPLTTGCAIMQMLGGLFKGVGGASSPSSTSTGGLGALGGRSSPGVSTRAPSGAPAATPPKKASETVVKSDSGKLPPLTPAEEAIRFPKGDDKGIT